jgi:rod shape-determining protein MreC
VGQATLSAENRQLRQLLGLQERLPPSFVPAEVIRTPGRASEGFFQLTAGTTSGVAMGASVVSPQGLVGRVTQVDASLAFGIDWMHTDFRASAMTVAGDVYGIVEPRRVGGEPMLVLTGTPRHIDLEANTLIVTSGHGGVFPRGIPIGTVVGPEGDQEGWQRNYLVRPLVAPSEMTYVLVLGEPQRALEGQDLALVWGIRPVDPLPLDEQVATTVPLEGPGAAVAPGAAGPSPPPVLGTPVQPPPGAAPPPPPPPPPPPAPPPPAGPPLLGDPVPPQD